MLEGKYVNLRSLEVEDLSTLKNWRNSKYIRKVTREYRLLNMFNQKSWFESLHKNNPPREIMFGILDKKNNLIGVCGLTYIDWKNRHSEISIYIAKAGWQKTKESRNTLSVIMKYAFGELGMHRLWAEIYGIAADTIKLFQMAGFKEEGILRDTIFREGKWWNSHLYSILALEFSK